MGFAVHVAKSFFFFLQQSCESLHLWHARMQGLCVAVCRFSFFPITISITNTNSNSCHYQYYYYLGLVTKSDGVSHSLTGRLPGQLPARYPVPGYPTRVASGDHHGKIFTLGCEPEFALGTSRPGQQP